MKLRKKIFPKTIADAMVTAFTLFIIPIIYYFELFVVLPIFHEPWSNWYIFHFIIGTFILFNLCSNLVAVILTDTSIEGVILPANGGKNWRFCSICETIAPPRSWHCPTCSTCILKRDHHCMFTSCCIGHKNHRYFIVFLLYIFVATLYSSFFNVQFIYKFIKLNDWLSLATVVFPLAMLTVDFSVFQLHLTFMIIVVAACVFTGTLLYYHMDLIVKGRVTYESKQQVSIYDQGSKRNLVGALGEKWRLVWVCPFIESKLPDDGVVWSTKSSFKGK